MCPFYPTDAFIAPSTLRLQLANKVMLPYDILNQANMDVLPADERMLL